MLTGGVSTQIGFALLTFKGIVYAPWTVICGCIAAMMIGRGAISLWELRKSHRVKHTLSSSHAENPAEKHIAIDVPCEFLCVPRTYAASAGPYNPIDCRRKIMSDDLTSEVISLLKDTFHMEECEVDPEADLAVGIGLDSLSRIEFVMAIEDHFNLELRNHVTQKVTTVTEIVELVRRLRSANSQTRSC